MGACVGLSKKELTLRIEENLNLGLSIDTRMDLASAAKESFDEKLA